MKKMDKKDGIKSFVTTIVFVMIIIAVAIFIVTYNRPVKYERTAVLSDFICIMSGWYEGVEKVNTMQITTKNESYNFTCAIGNVTFEYNGTSNQGNIIWLK